MKSQYTRLAEKCVENARKTLGAGWSHVSSDIQWALVADNILVTLLAQDDSVSDTAVRGLMHGVYNEAHRILESKPVG
jgi:hypothetical protein